MGTWASQHETEQNTNAVRGRLQVDTLQAQYVPVKGSSFLHVEHRFQNDPSAAIRLLRARVREWWHYFEGTWPRPYATDDLFASGDGRE